MDFIGAMFLPRSSPSFSIYFLPWQYGYNQFFRIYWESSLLFGTKILDFEGSNLGVGDLSIEMIENDLPV